MITKRSSKGRRSTDQTGAVLRLKRELTLERAKREVLQGVSRIALEARSLDRLYDHYLGVILKLTRTRAGSILLLDEVTKDLIVAACKGKGSEGLVGRRIPAGEGIAGWVLRTGRSYFTLDVEQDGPIRKVFGQGVGAGPQNRLCVPLKIARRVLGVVEVLNKKDRRSFQREDLRLLEALAAQVATVIENTRLFKKYDNKVRKLKTLKEISQLLNSTLDEKEVKRRAMEAATRLMEAEVGSLLLIDEATRELYFEVELGKRGERVKEVRLKVGEGIAGWVAKTGEPVIVADVRKDPRFSWKVEEKSLFKTRNMICVPIKIKGRIVGVLQAINKSGPQPFSKWDLEEFQSLADQVAVAIDNANLYKELQETFFGTAEALADAIEAKDPYTAGHTRRVLAYSMAMGKVLALSDLEMENLRLASLLHDIGKIGIEDRILLKPGKLEEAERLRMEGHTTIGPKIVDRVKQLRKIVPGIMHHHEKYDGTGYPSGLKGHQIPLIARIIGVADCFDAMTTNRPYRKGLSVQTALDEIQKLAGTQLDEKVVEAFVRTYRRNGLKETLKARSSAPAP
ncbi:MAG TPA: HD domain-containing phosphohydrolase [Nitrospiria bacterium]|jgi:putative nucleotidyltransferase with HDIG domain|nr:HD domain-containing phosphohydrolase [Nitrospiria bacterium]